MNTSVRPQDDLFEHANGAWLRTTSIPADRSRYGVDSIMAERSLVQQRTIMEQAIASRVPAVRKIGELYASFMDEAAIEAAGLSALAPELARIDAIRSSRDLAMVMAHLDRLGVSVPLSTFIDPDAKRSDRYAFWIYGSGLGLPERDYYSSTDPKLAAVRRQYQAYVEAMLAVSGQQAAAASARDVLELETAIAATHWARVDARDPQKTYNPVTAADLAKLAPRIDWTAYLDAQSVRGSTTPIIARQPSTVSGVNRLFGEVPLDAWRAYLRMRLLSAFAPYLPKAFADAHFGFEQGVLQGVKRPPERWKRGVALVDRLMSEASGRLYVERHFPPQAKRRADTMVANLVAAYDRAIERAEWLTPATRKEAQAKLRAMNVKIGHPDKWRDYSALRIVRADLLGNVLRAQAFEADRKRGQLAGPVDRDEWRMSAPTVDAYYSPTTNEIAFPAGVLQPPLFDPAADDAFNYGSTGATIGHEMGHGFDSRGSRYDAAGNLRDWWAPDDRKSFEEKAAVLVERFSRFEPLPGHKVDGRLTLSENLADLAGLEIAYNAYLASLGGRQPPVINGLTGEQRFFLGYAQSYMGKRRDELLIAQLKNNPHSPERYRVNGIVNNMAAFQAAFGVTPGDAMYLPPGERVRLWTE
jgi:predicted metalloendopeptidase